MDGKSLDIKQEKLEKLKELFPEVFTEDKVDWEKLKATLGEDINFSNERYVLNWAGKSDAFRALQTPTTATLIPAKEESVNFDDTNHIFIEGENLEVLKGLQKSYYGKIKMIYIDPPYNTGSDNFIYPDRFSESRDEYLKRIGDKDEAGYMTREGLFRKNSKDSGHYHSNWLSMMYPRLFLAKNLLKDDGVIFVSIDDNEVHNLRLMMNEIFGEENFVGKFVWQSKKGGGSDSGTVVIDQEYVLCFAKTNHPNLLSKIEIQPDVLDKKDKKGKYRQGRELNKWGSNSRREDRPTMFFPIPGPSGEDVYPLRNDGAEGCWRWGKKKMLDIVNKGDVEFVKRKDGSYVVYEKIRSTDPRSKPFRTWLTDVGTTADGSKLVKELFGGMKIFDFPKPVELLKILIDLGCVDDDSIILDYFAGSGSIANAVIELNKEDDLDRKFICIQFPEETDDKSEAFKAGYKTIADIGKERIRRVIKKIEKEQKENKDLFSGKNSNFDLGFKVFKLRSSNFKIWRGDVFENGEDLEKQLDAFTNPVKEDSSEENMLYELLLKSGYDLNSRIEKKSAYCVIDEDEMVVALSKMNEEIVKEIIELKPKKCIILDKLFVGNDQLKSNTVLQMKDAGIEFKGV